MSKRGNFAVPTGWSGPDRRFGEVIKENLDVLTGTRGDPLDRAITARDLISSGIARLPSGMTSFSGASNGLVPVSDSFETLDIPPAPTNLQANGAFENILLTWDLKQYKGHAFTQIYRHTSDDIANATLLGQLSGYTGVYADQVGESATYYYWVRAVNNNGEEGPFNSSTGTQGQTAPDVSFLLNKLSNAITSSELATSLATPINDIPGIKTEVQSLEGQYTVKIDNNGAVAGYGLASTANSAGNITSEFIVNADRFAIMRGGSNTATATVPFVVQATATTLNGETVPAGVYMADAFIKNGSIQSAKIGSLNADKITAGTIDAARIGANTVSATKIQTGTLDVTNVNITGTSSSGINIKSASSGSRMEITSDVIKIYDGSTLRVKLGNL